MTVIVKYDQEGKPQFQSAKGIGSTDDERAQARLLDALLKKELTKLKQSLIKAGSMTKNTKGNVELYWELGTVLRNIFFDSHLIDASEKYLYWLNAQLHVPEELLAKDRGPNRLHLEYCFRLAGFPKDKATRMKWGEWVYLFDSPGINRELRFDKWVEGKMKVEPDKFSRDDVRILAQAINGLLGNIETKDLSDELLKHRYEVAWFIKENFRNKVKELPNNELKKALKAGIKKNYVKLDEVEATAFALLVAEKITHE